MRRWKRRMTFAREPADTFVRYTERTFASNVSASSSSRQSGLLTTVCTGNADRCPTCSSPLRVADDHLAERQHVTAARGRRGVVHPPCATAVYPQVVDRFSDRTAHAPASAVAAPDEQALAHDAVPPIPKRPRHALARRLLRTQATSGERVSACHVTGSPSSRASAWNRPSWLCGPCRSAGSRARSSHVT